MLFRSGEVARLQEEAVELIHCLVLFWEPGELSDAERAGFHATARALQERLGRMISLEEGKLFPACAANVPPDDLLDWIESFRRVELERSQGARWAPDLAELSTRWNA